MGFIDSVLAPKVETGRHAFEDHRFFTLLLVGRVSGSTCMVGTTMRMLGFSQDICFRQFFGLGFICQFLEHANILSKRNLH